MMRCNGVCCGGLVSPGKGLRVYANAVDSAVCNLTLAVGASKEDQRVGSCSGIYLSSCVLWLSVPRDARDSWA
jgi:hypothetical protein